jgi:hypothetical protein
MALCIAGCAHRTRVVSTPPGAAVYVDEQFVCTTPCFYERPATELEDHTPVRVERPGYHTVQGTLETAILPSRVVGGLFTLGLVPLFKWPHTYKSVQTFTLRPLTREERLAEVEELYRRGTVSADEYRELRLDVLGR